MGLGDIFLALSPYPVLLPRPLRAPCLSFPVPILGGRLGRPGEAAEPSAPAPRGERGHLGKRRRGAS